MRIFSILFLSLVFLLPFGAIGAEGKPSLAPQQTVTPQDLAAIQNTISSQIDAFRADNGTRAFSYAAPTIQRIFGSVERFMQMVKNGYPQVYRPQEVEFRDLVQVDGSLVQRVLIVGPDNRAVMALYTMVQMENGDWKIAGCKLVDATDQVV